MKWPEEWDSCGESVPEFDGWYDEPCGEPPVAAARYNDDGERDDKGDLLGPVCEAHR